MASYGAGFLPLDRQKFGSGLGEAVAALIRQRYPRDTAKQVARAWGLDPSTAANVVKGHCSERTLTKAMQAEGWPLIQALGATFTGETFEQYEERRLQSLIKEASDGLEKIRSFAARREALEARAVRAVADLDWSPVDEGRGSQIRSWAPLDDSRPEPSRPHQEG